MGDEEGLLFSIPLPLASKVAPSPCARLAQSVCCATSGGEAAETAPAKKNSAWILDFDSWAQGSSGYAGVDSEMRMRLKTLYFAANRPTIGALIALGGDVGAAFSTGKPEVHKPV